jgi:transcriptional regulator with XRE-family HTH domain
MDEITIGTNIRRRRERLALTLTELARQANLTKGALSKIETGKGSPAIATMLRIAKALGTSLSELFAEEETPAPYAFTPNGQGQVITRDGSRFGYAYQALALSMKNKAVEPFLLTIRPGDPPGVFHHEGQEFIYMLSGLMEFSIGQQKLRLSRGDALYFDSSHKHSTHILGKKPATFLCLFIPKDRPADSTGPRRKKT